MPAMSGASAPGLERARDQRRRPRPRPRGRAGPAGLAGLGLTVVAVALVGTACVAGRAALIKAPPPLPPTTSTTAVPDFSGIGLASAPGRTTTTIPMGPGGATLSGTVTGPSGPVGGAVVHVERLVDNSETAVDVPTQADGTWTLPSILGGRYRVRAYRPPDLAQLDAQILWLKGDETHQLALTLSQFSGVDVSAAIAPNPPVVGQPANLVVQVTTRSVDSQGVVRAVPVANTEVQLGGTGQWTVTPNPSPTSGNGRVAYQVVCQQVGDQQLVAMLGGTDSFPLNLPACVPQPPATTEPPTTSTTSVVTVPSGSTTTTARARSTTTTTG